jgi:hypothetical protein
MVDGEVVEEEISGALKRVRRGLNESPRATPTKVYQTQAKQQQNSKYKKKTNTTKAK